MNITGWLLTAVFLQSPTPQDHSHHMTMAPTRTTFEQKEFLEYDECWERVTMLIRTYAEEKASDGASPRDSIQRQGNTVLIVDFSKGYSLFMSCTYLDEESDAHIKGSTLLRMKPLMDREK